MEDMDLVKLSVAISKKLGEPVVLVVCEKVSRGYHAQGYRLHAEDGRRFFIKKIDPIVSGLEFPERKLSSLLVGHGMAKRFDMKPQTLGVFIETEGEIEVMPELSHETVVYHLQEFESEGKSYLSLLGAKAEKTAVDEEDLHEMQGVIEYIARVHALKHPSDDPAMLRAVYNDGLREEIVHPELTISLLHEIEDDHPFIAPAEQGAYLSLLLQTMHAWRNRSDRLCALHGDFWGANVFVREDGSVWAIDYSRVPWGDPGIDIGKWCAYYLWMYHQTGNAYFKELGQMFVSLYKERTGDMEIEKAMCLGIMFSGVVYNVFSNVDIAIRKNTFDHICSILKEGRFSWEF